MGTQTQCSSSAAPSRAAKSTENGPESPTISEGRDLAITSDYRQVLGEVIAKTLGANNLQVTFPGARITPKEFLGICS
jgi:hypothetical protein